jgi:hypothetical protein
MDTPPGIRPYAYGYVDSQNRFRDVMASDCPAPGPNATGDAHCPRALFYSTTAATYNGLAIGNASNADAARVLNEFRVQVANYRDSGVSATPTPTPTATARPTPTPTPTSTPGSMWHSFFAVDTRETPYVGDFNGDGKTDIITFTRDNPAAIGDVFVSLSNGSQFGASAKWNDWFAISHDETVVIGDYNGDGKDDIATWLGKSTRQVYVALSQTGGMNEATVWLGAIGQDPTDVIEAGDVNGDGKDDIVDFARKQGKVYVALSSGGSFQAPVVWHNFFAVSTYERPKVGDVNGDGKADIVTFATDSPTAFGDVYVATSTGTQFSDLQSSTKWHDWFAIRPEELVRIADLNGDGRADFYTFLPAPYAQCYTASSMGTAMGDNVLWRESIGGPSTDVIFVGDVNGDHKADVITFAQGEGKVYVSLAQ